MKTSTIARHAPVTAPCLARSNQTRWSAALLPLAFVLGACGTMRGGKGGHEGNVSSPFAKESAGKILFSAQPIPRDVADGGQISSSLSLAKPAYYRAFFTVPAAKALKDAGVQCKDNGGDEFNIEIRNTKDSPDSWTGLSTDRDPSRKPSFSEWTSVTWSQLLGNSKPNESNKLAESMVAFLAQFPPGKLSLEVRMQVSCDEDGGKHGRRVELARGPLEIELSDAALADYVHANHLELKGTTFADSNEAKKIEAEMRRLAAGSTVVKVLTLAPNWTIERDPLNKPLRRWVGAIGVVQEGRRCRVYRMRAVEESMGADSYVSTPTLQNGVIPLAVPTDGLPTPCQVAL